MSFSGIALFWKQIEYLSILMWTLSKLNYVGITYIGFVIQTSFFSGETWEVIILKGKRESAYKMPYLYLLFDPDFLLTQIFQLSKWFFFQFLYANISGRYVHSAFVSSGYTLVHYSQVCWTSFDALAWEKTEGESSRHRHKAHSLWRWVHSIHQPWCCTQGNQRTMIICYIFYMMEVQTSCFKIS
jgi:hypothetical protein